MTENQLVILDSIVRTGSFKQASIELSKSQSSLSVAIKNLEEELGFLIFDRSDYRPSITEKGSIFYTRSLKLIEQYATLYKFGKDLGQIEKPLIKISIDCVIPFINVLNILNTFQSSSPNTKLQIRTDAIDGGLDQLNDDSVEMAIIPNIGIPSYIHKEKITTINFRPCISPQAFKRLNGDFEKLPRIVINSSAQQPLRQTNLIQEETEIWQVNDHNYKSLLIKNGLGWGNLPIQMFNEDIENGKLIILDNAATLEDIDFYIARKKTTYLSESSKQLWNLIKDEFH